MSKIERFVIYPLVLGLIFVLAPFDLGIMQSLYNPVDFFGRFGECFMEIPFQWLCVFASWFLFLNRPRETKNQNIWFGILFGFLVFFFSAYGAGMIESYTGDYPGWSPILTWTLTIITGLGYLISGYFAAKKIRLQNKNKVFAWAIFVVILYFMVFLTMDLFKLLWYRPRWKYLVTITDDPASAFVPVWILDPHFAFLNRFASFPSGHTMNAVSIICLSVLFKTEGNNKLAFIMRIIAYVWGAVFAVSRTVMGAHFFTDISAGFLLGFLLFDVASTFIYPAFERLLSSKAPIENQVLTE